MTLDKKVDFLDKMLAVLQGDGLEAYNGTKSFILETFPPSIPGHGDSSKPDFFLFLLQSHTPMAGRSCGSDPSVKQSSNSFYKVNSMVGRVLQPGHNYLPVGHPDNFPLGRALLHGARGHVSIYSYFYCRRVHVSRASLLWRTYEHQNGNFMLLADLNFTQFDRNNTISPMHQRML